MSKTEEIKTFSLAVSLSNPLQPAGFCFSCAGAVRWSPPFWTSEPLELSTRRSTWRYPACESGSARTGDRAPAEPAGR